MVNFLVFDLMLTPSSDNFEDLSIWNLSVQVHVRPAYVCELLLISKRAFFQTKIILVALAHHNFRLW